MIAGELSETVSDRSVVAGSPGSTPQSCERTRFRFRAATICADAEKPICCRYHLESVDCISGCGEVETAGSGRIPALRHEPCMTIPVYLLEAEAN